MSPNRSLLAIAAAVTGLALTTGCGTDGREVVTVLTASSLTGAFDDIESVYEDRHPDVDVVISTGGSPSVAAQAAEGSPAALLVTADKRSTQRAIDAAVTVGDAEGIATNRIVAATSITADVDPPLSRIDQLGTTDLLVSQCAPVVPCGRAAVSLLEDQGVQVAPDSTESSVQAVVTRLRLGEVDVGFVYRTDVAASDGEIVALADDAPDQVGRVRYLATALRGQPGGEDLLDFLISDDGQRVLAEHGFGPA